MIIIIMNMNTAASGPPMLQLMAHWAATAAVTFRRSEKDIARFLDAAVPARGESVVCPRWSLLHLNLSRRIL
jgi:hypothetical protein